MSLGYYWRGAYLEEKCQKSVTIQDNKDHVVMPEALYRCFTMETLTINNSIEIIGANAFRDCIKLTSVSLPTELVEIGSGAFRNCSKLTKIVVPDKVYKIGTYAFWAMPALTTLSLPEALTTGNVWLSNSYNVVMSVSNKTGTALHSTDSTGKFLFKHDRTVLIYVASKSTVSLSDLPKETTNLYQYSLSACNWSSVTIPSQVTTMGAFLFEGSTKVKNIKIGAGVTKIDGACFQNCKKVTAFTVDSGNKDFKAVDGIIYNYNKSQLMFYPTAKTPTSTTMTLPDELQGFASCPFPVGLKISHFRFTTQQK